MDSEAKDQMESYASLVRKIGSRFIDPKIALMTGEDLIGKVQRDLLDLAYRNNWANILVNLAASAGLILMFWAQEDLSASTAVWFAVVVILCVVRLWGSYLYRRARMGISELRTDDFLRWHFR
ncbi:MAG: hypothetical protein RLN85_12385, partial [Pseudomonadales bacterium]